MRRVPILLVVLLLTTCSAGPVAMRSSPEETTRVATVIGEEQTATPAPETPPETPMPTPTPTPRPPRSTTPSPRPEPSERAPLERVRSLLPEIRIDAQEALPGDIASRAMAVPGVVFATAVAVDELTVTLADGRRGRLRTAAVDPLAYRVLVPQITADSDAVWDRLLAGDLVGTHELASDHGVELGSMIGTPAGPLRLSALAALGQPAIAGAVVDGRLGPDLGLGPASTLLVAVHPDAWPDEVAAALEDALGMEATLVYGKPQRELAGLPDGGTVWDALAICESSGRWDIDSGNGYYGGLQFLPSSWHLVGGTGMPHEANRDEQIYRAELLLRRQGWKAWPVCSVKLGLREPDPDEQHLDAAAAP